MELRFTSVRLVAVVVLCLSVPLAVAQGDEVSGLVNYGQLAECNTFQSTATTPQGVSVVGSARLEVNEDGTSSWGVLQVSVLQEDGSVYEPETALTVHVHANSCSEDDGGPHWMFDPSFEGEASTENEFWFELPAVTGDEERVDVVVNDNWALTDDIRSIVIHAENTTTRLACCDLTVESAVEFRTEEEVDEVDLDETPLPGYGTLATCSEFVATANTPEGVTVEGAATLEINEAEDASWGILSVTVNDGDELYQQGTTLPVHVHATSCSENDGGPHWMLDPNFEGEASEENEFWFFLPSPSADSGERTDVAVNDNFALQDDIKSIVIHAKNTTIRLACCDLEVVDAVEFRDAEESGSTTPTEPMMTPPSASSNEEDADSGSRINSFAAFILVIVLLACSL